MSKTIEKISMSIFVVSFVITYYMAFNMFLYLSFDDYTFFSETEFIINLYILLFLGLVSIGTLFLKNAPNKFLFFKYNIFLVSSGALQHFVMLTIADTWKPYNIVEKVLVVSFGFVGMFLFLGAISYLISMVFHFRYDQKYTFTEIIEEKDLYNSKGLINGSVYFFIGVIALFVTFFPAFIGFDEPPMFGIVSLIVNIVYVVLFAYLYVQKKDTLTLFVLVISSGFLLYYGYNGFILKEVLFSDINNFWFSVMMYTMYGFIFIMGWLVTFNFISGYKTNYNITLYLYSIFTLLHFVSIRFVERNGVIYVQYILEYVALVFVTALTFTFITPLIIEVVKVKTRKE